MMAWRNGTIHISWSLHVTGAETDPDNLLAISRSAIAEAIEDGDSFGSVTENVGYDDANGVPDGVTPEPGGS